MRRIPLPKRFLSALLMGLLAIIVVTVPAFAGVSWCRADPIVRLNGTDVQIWVAVPEQYQSLVNGPIEVSIGVPGSVSREVVLLDSGFNGYGETVTFTDRGRVWYGGRFITVITIRVPVAVSAPYEAYSIPVQVEVVQNGVSEWFTGSAAGTWATVTVQGLLQ